MKYSHELVRQISGKDPVTTALLIGIAVGYLAKKAINAITKHESFKEA